MEISAQRRELVERARQAWIKQLIDISRRNNLLFYRPLKWGTLDLSLGDGERWHALLRGESVSLTSLVGDSESEDLKLKGLAIWRRAQANQEERGLATLFVALGMASWTVSDGGRDAEAPVLLLPVNIQMKGHSGTSFAVQIAGPVQVNLVLLHVLATEFGISISPDSVLSQLQGGDEGEIFDSAPVYRLFTAKCASVPGFGIQDSVVLGNFAFQKMAMVRDLQECGDQLASNDIIAAIAGDKDAKELVGAKTQNTDPKEFDTLPPQSEFLVLDADSSQQSAISAVLAGQSTVIHGPPGTGKSQTIANLVASLAAAGKRVLFVAEKRAALQVVLKRLQQVGLDKLAIDLHGADVSSRRVMEQVAAALTAVREASAVDCDLLHQQFVERRARLNRHVESLHRKRKPGGLSVYELQGFLLHLQTKSNVRWRGSELRKIEDAGPRKVRDLIREAQGLAALFLRCDPSPWNGVKLADGPAAQHAVDLVARMTSESLPECVASLQKSADELDVRVPTGLKEGQRLYALAEAVERTLSLYAPEIFGEDIGRMASVLARGKSSRLVAVWAWCTSSDYRHARRQALGFRRAGKISGPQLSAELEAANRQKTEWAEWSHASLPRRLSGRVEAHRKLLTVARDVEALESVLASGRFGSVTFDEIGSSVSALAGDRLTPMRLPVLYRVERELEASGIRKLIEEIRKEKTSPEEWIALFDHAWYSSCLEAAQIDDPEIAGFDGRTHDSFVKDFKELDKERIQVAAARVRRAYAERAISAMNEYKNEEYVIRSEAEKKRRHRPLRSIFAEARHVLTALCPCWMASPLSVSQLLDTTRCFDFAIFDEASQVLPEDAIPAVMRGTHVVVAGDSWQLPPTTFFAAADGDGTLEDESSYSTEGFESFLDITNSFMPAWYLDWHYRSRDEALISFSNHHIYKDRLVTFPGPGGEPVVRHELVEQELGLDGQEESSSAEVTKVVDLVLEHAAKRREESLGVIAMGIRHADRIQRALDEAISRHPELGEFFDVSAEERFFVKNLERVQGDERDAIILTIGYGKDRGGNLPFRFGPLLSSGGQRRLNVAVTRARRRMTLVSSFSHLDMDLGKIRPGTGVELLRFYLEYAASGGKRLGDLVSTGFPMNSFEAEVFDTLQSNGIPLVSQCGASSYRIDLVAQHPQQPGKFVLAIECDGASYHSSPTARDRDRLRQQQLENLGWRFHRIWSTDWFMRKDDEIHRAVEAYQAAVSAADAGSQPREAPSHVPTTAELDARVVPPSGRTARPPLSRRAAITDYSEDDLVGVIKWIESDGCLRTDEQIIEEASSQLGFQRRGSRIETTIQSAINRYRAANDRGPHAR